MNRNSLVAAALCLAASAGQAASIHLTGEQTQTANAQLMTFTFSGLSSSALTAGSFSMRALGDYNSDQPTETITSVTIDGFSVGANLGPGQGNVTLLSETLYYSEWSYAAMLSQADLMAALADGEIVIQVQIGFNSGVFAAGTDTGYDRDPYVSVALDYRSADNAVPTPASGALLLAGLGALAGCSARRRSRAGGVAAAQGC